MALASPDPLVFIKEAQTLLDDAEAYEVMSKASNPYGNGDACEKIISFLKNRDT